MNLFLASTHDFKTLPQRRPPGVDQAIIVPLPPPPKSDREEGAEDLGVLSSDSSSSSESEAEDPPPEIKLETSSDEPLPPPLPTTAFDPSKTELVEDTEATKGGAGGPPPSPPRPAPRRRRDKDDYTLLLSLTKDRAPKIINRDDGFEKRWIWRCGRCRLIVGYQLDDAHFLSPSEKAEAAATIMPVGMTEKEKEKAKAKADRKRKRYLYILPDAVTPTEELGRPQAVEQQKETDSPEAKKEVEQ